MNTLCSRKYPGMSSEWQRPNVVAGFMHNDITLFHTFEGGTVTSQRCCKDIIQNHVHLFKDAVAADFLFMEDIARPQRSSQILDTSETIERMRGLLITLT